MGGGLAITEKLSASTTAAAPEPRQPVRREAVVFIPGLGGATAPLDQTTDGIARRLAVALDRRAKTGSAKFHVELATESYGDGHRTEACTIFRRDTGAGDPVPVVDVYGLEYQETLLGGFKKLSVAHRSLLLLITVISGSWRMLGALFGRRPKGKGGRDRFQFLFGGFIILAMSAYLVVLFAALAGLSLRALGQAPKGDGAGQESALAPIASFLADLPWLPATTGVLTWLVVVVSTVTLLVPRSVRTMVEDLSRNYFSLSEYLNVGAQRQVIGGRLDALLEHLAEKETPPQRIHLMTYSFGSILALDALLPKGQNIGPRLGTVASLVTIGCPFDLIRTFWPEYFTARRMATATGTAPAALGRWFNVYSNADVLGSNFRNDANDASATESIALDEQSGAARAPCPINLSYGNREVSMLDILKLVGLRTHALYWEATFSGETSCFHDIVEHLWRDEPILA